MEEAKQNCRVLIVDDSDFSRKSISEMLNEPKYEIIGEAANGREAINVLKESSADVILLDIVMPEMSGLELAEFITQNFTDINIIMMSSLAQENIVIDAISAGACDFLQKPFDKKTLVNSVDKVFASIEVE